MPFYESGPKMIVMNKKRKSGFTLIEVLLAIVFVGIAIASLLGASSIFTNANQAGLEMSTAEFLAEQMRELITMTSYDDLDNFDDANYSPPLNAKQEQLSNFTQFSQQITVENVSASNLQQVVSDGGSDFLRVTVEIYSNSVEVSSSSWIRANY